MAGDAPMNSSLAPSSDCAHIGHMDDGREAAVRQALELYPGSLRALGREAGISYRLLGMIRDGDRSATRETVEALAGAMENLRDRHDKAARVLRDSLEREGGTE